MKRIISLIIVLAIGVCCFSANALAFETDQIIYVGAYSDLRGEITLSLLNHNDDLYISQKQASFLAQKDDYHPSQKIEQGAIEYEGTLFYRLNEIMNELHVAYSYSEEIKTLVFVQQYTVDEIYQLCSTIYKEGYELNFLDNVIGVGLAAAYNIIGGLKLNILWGGYQREQYEKAIAGILDSGQQLESIDLAKTAEKTMKGLSLCLKLKKDGDEMAELFGTNIDGFIEAYDILNNAIPGIAFKDAIELYGRFYAAKTPTDYLVKAVEYGLIKNETIDNELISAAADKIYTYYINESPGIGLAIDAGFRATEASLITEPLKEMLKDANIIKSVYVKAAKMILDELGLEELTKAVEQTLACADIQTISSRQYSNYEKQYRARIHDRDTGLGMKYCTILYLRACQYAYGLYKFDEDIGWVSDFWKERTQKAIDLLTMVDDSSIVERTRNQAIRASSIEYSAYASKIDIIIERKDHSAYFDSGKTKCLQYFDLPIALGDSEQAKRINSVMEGFYAEAAEKFPGFVSNVDLELSGWIGDVENVDRPSFDTYTAKVTYSDENYISILIESSSWVYGTTADSFGLHGFCFDVKTGNVVQLSEALGDNWKEKAQEILSEAPIMDWLYDIDKISFCLSAAGEVLLCDNQYVTSAPSCGWFDPIPTDVFICESENPDDLPDELKDQTEESGLSDADMKQMKSAIRFYEYDVDAESILYSLGSSYDPDLSQEYGCEIETINGNPSMKEIERAFSNSASAYLTVDLIQRLIPLVRDCFKVIDGKICWEVSYVGEPGIADDSFSYSIEDGSYRVYYNYDIGERLSTPDRVATFVRQNGKFMLRSVESYQ